MEIHSIYDVAKLLSTAAVSEQYSVATVNVLDACKKGRLTEDEAVLTSVGWLITPEGAARLWSHRNTIESTVTDALMGKTWPKEQAVEEARQTILPLLSIERKRHFVLSMKHARKMLIEFKDKTLAVYSDAEDDASFHVAHVEPIEKTTLYTCPRGREGEVYREIYDTTYEAEQRIRSFDDEPGWAKYANECNEAELLGEHI